jgi:hypothetical protein
MDDLTTLREYRAEEPGPSPAETTAARTALLTAIETASPRPRTGRRPVWVPVTALAAAGLAAVGLIVGGAVGGGRPAPAPPATLDAAVVLHQAARSAARQDPASGRFFFTESEYVDDALYVTPHHITPRWSSPALRRYWLGHYTDGLLRDPAAGPGPLKLAPGVPVGGGPALTWSQVRHLPTALPRLRRVVFRLAADSGQRPRAVADFRVITELLYESPAPPRLRAALYDLAATLPGVRLVRGTHDLVGRAATEVYLGGGWNLPGGGGQALYFSPATGAVLGWAQLGGAGPQCPPTSEYAVLATGYVSSTRRVPPGTPGHLVPATYPRHVPGCARP